MLLCVAERLNQGCCVSPSSLPLRFGFVIVVDVVVDVIIVDVYYTSKLSKGKVQLRLCFELGRHVIA